MAERILLSAGTNEMELLVFRVDQSDYGINVAKVREIIQRQKVNAVPLAPPAVEGTFLLRDEVLTLVSLSRCLGTHGTAAHQSGLIIIIEFNRMRCGILVDSVESIYRLSWKEIQSPPACLMDYQVPVTGVVNLPDKTVLVLDFESLISDILGVPNASMPTEASIAPRERKDARVLIVDDSTSIRAMVANILKLGGFVDVTICHDGQHAWDTILSRVTGEDPPFDVVLTDIEMPRMDGFHLTQRIKSDPKLHRMFVVVFSSLVSDDNVRKGHEVGADAQVTKFEGDALLQAIDEGLRATASAA